MYIPSYRLHMWFADVGETLVDAKTFGVPEIGVKDIAM